jgi:hypothetical protein
MPFPLSFFFCIGIYSFFSTQGFSSFFSTRFSMPWPLCFFLCRIETFGMACSSTASLRDDNLVKGLLTLMLDVEGDEEKCSFFPFFFVFLVK